MSDGEPNDGKVGDELISYADEIKKDGIYIYTLGFFENMGGYRSSAQALMEGIASSGCHYEVADANDLCFLWRHCRSAKRTKIHLRSHCLSR